MKKLSLKFAMLFVLLTMFTSCELVGDILQVGIGIGIFIVVIVVALIWWIIRKFRR